MVLEGGPAPRVANQHRRAGQENVEFGVLSLAGRNAVRTAATATGNSLIRRTAAGIGRPNKELKSYGIKG